MGGASSYWPSNGVPRPLGPIDRVCTARYRVLNFEQKNPYEPCLENTAIEVGIEVPTKRNPHVDFISLKSPHYAPKSTPNTGYDNVYYSFHRAEPT